MSYVDLDTIHVPAHNVAPPRAWGSQIPLNFEDLFDQPSVEAAQFSLSIPNNTQTTITFTGAGYDSHDMHDPAVNNHRFTATVAGWYLVGGSIIFPPSVSSGRSLLSLWKNGSVIRRTDQLTIPGQSLRFGLTVRAMVQMNVGDYVELRYYHTTGAGLTASFRFGATRMGPLAPSAGFSYRDLEEIHRPKVLTAVPHTWAAQVRTNFEALRNRPMCVVSSGANLSVPAASAVPVVLNVEDTDAYGMHSGTSNQISVPRLGTYLVLANGVWESTASGGVRLLAIETNFYGTFFSSPIVHAVPSDSHGISHGFILRCPAAGSVVQLTAYHAGGPANLNLLAGAQLALIWLGD